MRAKFRKDGNFLVREIGQGRDVEERSLEMTEVSREGGRRWCRQEFGLQILWKKERERDIGL